MALADFLFQGSPPPQASSYSSTSASLPDWFSAAAQGLIARANSIASEPFQQYTGPRIAGFDPLQEQSYNNISAGAGAWQPNLQGALSLVNSAGGTDSRAAADPLLGRAGALSATAAAQPYLNQAGQTFPGAVNDYMSPYLDTVVNRVAELGNRNLTENLLPALQDRFIAAGHPGSSRASEFAGRAVRDVGSEIAAQQGALLNQGYTQAGQLFQNDQSRLGALAQTAGGLAGSEQSNLGSLAQLTGQLTSDTAGRQLAAGQQLGALGQAQQQLGLNDAAALEAAGAARQGQQQRNLDLAYQNFAEQRDYPRNNVAFLNEAIRGAAPAAPASTTTQTSAPASVVGTSPLAQLAGAGLSVAALAKSGLLGKARGGAIRPRFARGGALAMVAHA